MRILFINDSTSNPNWGDRAASLMLQKMLLESGCRITHRITEYDLGSGAFLHDDDPHDRPPALAPRRSRFEMIVPPALLGLSGKLRGRLGPSRRRVEIPARFEQFAGLAGRIVQEPGRHARLLAAIEEADAAVIHGDGCMVGRGPLPRAELFLAHFLKREFAKPVVLVNHTADLDDPDLLEMARQTYPLLDDVVYRDRRSLERWRDAWPGRYAADSAFLLQPAPPETWLPIAGRHAYFDVWPDRARFDPSRPYICIGGSSLFSYSDHPRTLIDDLAELVRHLRDRFSAQIVLTASDGRDQWIFRPLAARLELPLVSLMTPVQQAVDILGNALAYVGGRWHASIFALRGGVPVVPLSAKTFKMQALAEMAGLPAAPFDALAVARDKDAIGRALADCLAGGDELRGRLRGWAREQAELSKGNIEHIERLLRTPSG